MAKIINIFTRLEETEHSLDEQGGKDLLNYLMEYKANNRSTMSFGEHFIIAQIIRMVENNSGVNVTQLVQERNAK